MLIRPEGYSCDVIDPTQAWHSRVETNKIPLAYQVTFVNWLGVGTSLLISQLFSTWIHEVANYRFRQTLKCGRNLPTAHCLQVWIRLSVRAEKCRLRSRPLTTLYFPGRRQMARPSGPVRRAIGQGRYVSQFHAASYRNHNHNYSGFWTAFVAHRPTPVSKRRKIFITVAQEKEKFRFWRVLYIR